MSNKMYTFNCPHCNDLIMVMHKDIKCGIFIHAVYKKSGKQINPHTKEKKCNQLLNQKKILGCAKPFKFDGNVAQICDYS